MKENKYTISEAARLLSVENHVLRYWEEELELNIPRNELGHRYYREEEIQLLHCIKELKNKGFQLKAVKEVLPDLEQKKLIDIHKLLTTQEEPTLFLEDSIFGNCDFLSCFLGASYGFIEFFVAFFFPLFLFYH